jgi:hypothetical protein
MLVCLATRENVRTIFTLDRRDVSVYRTGRKRALRIVPEEECLSGIAEWTYSGILACFFLGLLSRLFSRARNEVMMWARVSAGSITASM